MRRLAGAPLPHIKYVGKATAEECPVIAKAQETRCVQKLFIAHCPPGTHPAASEPTLCATRFLLTNHSNRD